MVIILVSKRLNLSISLDFFYYYIVIYVFLRFFVFGLVGIMKLGLISGFQVQNAPPVR